MSEDARGLHFYFLRQPHDDTLKTEAEIVKDHIPIRSPADFVFRALAEVKRTGRKIDTLVLSGHGQRGHIYLGDGEIAMDTIHIWAPILAMLRPYFNRDAVVTIWSCDVGRTPELLQKLSWIWGGIKVQAWTEDAVVFKAGPFQGNYAEGDRIVCLYNFCWMDPAPFDPRLPRGEDKTTSFPY